MTTKEYFNSIRKLKSRIQTKILQAETMRELASNISPNYSSMPHEPPKTTSPMADAICKAIDLENEATILRKKLSEKEMEAMELICRIPKSDIQNVLIRRYIRFESWEQISGSMFYSLRTVYRLNKEAVFLFDKVLESVAVDGS